MMWMKKKNVYMYLQNVIVKCTYKNILPFIFIYKKEIILHTKYTLKWPQCFKYIFKKSGRLL